MERRRRCERNGEGGGRRREELRREQEREIRWERGRRNEERRKEGESAAGDDTNTLRRVIRNLLLTWEAFSVVLIIQTLGRSDSLCTGTDGHYSHVMGH